MPANRFDALVGRPEEDQEPDNPFDALVSSSQDSTQVQPVMDNASQGPNPFDSLVSSSGESEEPEPITPEDALRQGVREQDLGLLDRFLVGAGGRASELLDFVGLEGILGENAPTEPLPELGAAGFVGEMFADTPLFIGLGGAGRAVGGAAKAKGAGKIGQAIAREGTVGAGFGAITSPGDRLEGAGRDALLFGGLGGGIAAASKVPGAAQAIKRLRASSAATEAERKAAREATETWVRAGVSPVGELRKTFKPVVKESDDALAGVVFKETEAATRPLPTQVVKPYTKLATKTIDPAMSTSEQKQKLHGVMSRIKEDLGWEESQVRDVFEALTTSRSTKQMLEEGADESLIILNSMHRVGKALPEDLKKNPLYVANVAMDSSINPVPVTGVFDGVRKRAEPAMDFFARKQGDTNVPIYDLAVDVETQVREYQNLMTRMEEAFALRVGDARVSSSRIEKVTAFAKGPELSGRVAKGEQLTGDDARLWKMIQEGLDLAPEERRIAEAATAELEEFRTLINESGIIGKNGKPIVLPERPGYVPKLVDLDNAFQEISEAMGFKVGQASFLKVNKNAAERYETNLIEALRVYRNRASKLLTYEKPLRGFLEMAEEVRSTSPDIADAMEWWASRQWGIPTKGDENLGRAMERFGKLFGADLDLDTVRNSANIVRDLGYMSMMFARLPFAPARNLTQGSLTSAIVGAPATARGYVQGIWEIAKYAAKKPSIVDEMIEIGAIPKWGESLDIVINESDKLLSSAKAAKATGKLRDALGFLFIGSDRLNRVAGFSAGTNAWNRVAKKFEKIPLKERSIDKFISDLPLNTFKDAEIKRIKNLLRKGSFGSESWETARKTYGKMIADKTQFPYSSTGSPLATRGITGKLGLQFLTWPMYYGSFMADMFTNTRQPTKVAHWLATTWAAWEFLAFIDYNPAGSLLFGPFMAPTERSEFGAFLPSPGPAVSMPIDLVFSMVQDAQNLTDAALGGQELEGSQFLRSIAKNIGTFTPGSSIPKTDIPRLKRIMEGEQKNKSRFTDVINEIIGAR